MNWQAVVTGLVVAADAATIVRALLRPHREPASRLAWICAILALPIAGVLLYLVVGETRISARKIAKGRAIVASLERPAGNYQRGASAARSAHWAPFALARTINQLDPSAGNAARLARDSNAAIDEMIADIDAARETIHGCFYIWLGDTNGVKLKTAMVRAAQRGVKVRVLADALGSRRLISSEHWRAMRDGGCDVRAALPVGNPLWTVIRGRLDLRNHRKLLIVDNRIAWCGSQNCADPEFLIKPRFAPWVDIMSRWTGPVVRHCQFLFAADWIGEGGGDDVRALLRETLDTGEGEGENGGAIVAQVFGTGPAGEFDAVPACFAEAIHSARTELVVTTPYFVPDEQLLFALTSAARRGVRTVLIFPKRNDNWIVAGASRSYYKTLIDAGAEIYEFRPGLLHAKTMAVDGCVGLIGSANLDRRSFELNSEINILFEDPAFTAALRARQDEYLAQCDRVTSADVERYGMAFQLWQNLLATLSPML
ncbi:MAG: cardiolipin synthase [Sphingomicrobium sp.]